MFGRSSEPQPERHPRVTHTPGAYPPLTPRNDPRSRGQGPESVVALGATAQPPAAPQTPPTPAPKESSMSQARPVAADAPATASEPASRLIVGPEVKLLGAQIQDCDTLVVEGRVEATLDSRLLRIAEAGSFAGKVGIEIAEIDGEFQGELTARKQLIIHAGGKVSGKIRYGSLLIEAGGRISGDVQALGESPQANANNAQGTAQNLNAQSTVSPPINSEKEVERTSNVKALISSVA